METEQNNKFYHRIDALDNTYKPLILKWLSKLFGYNNYPHSSKDQWISWKIWNNELTIFLDSRQKEHRKLLSLIPKQFLGTPQYKTLKIVNKDIFYLRLNKLFLIGYPDIIGNKFIGKKLCNTFYVYDWKVILDDNTSIHYHNQRNKMDMIKGSFIYDCTIQERAFTQFLNNLTNI